MLLSLVVAVVVMEKQVVVVPVDIEVVLLEKAQVVEVL
jgi:hypothetical protein|tara:strand:+ start:131 stop:244 length:114 start_codon:yes stop_codon:yes gene_type:complete